SWWWRRSGPDGSRPCAGRTTSPTSRIRSGRRSTLERPVALGTASRGRRLRHELLAQDPLLEVMLGVEQQVQRDVAILADLHLGDVADLGEVGGGGNRAALRLADDEAHLRRPRQDGAAPAPRPERADRRQGERTRADRQD